MRPAFGDLKVPTGQPFVAIGMVRAVVGQMTKALVGDLLTLRGFRDGRHQEPQASVRPWMQV